VNNNVLKWQFLKVILSNEQALSQLVAKWSIGEVTADNFASFLKRSLTDFGGQQKFQFLCESKSPISSNYTWFLILSFPLSSSVLVLSSLCFPT
jgi:hypothetical protein